MTAAATLRALARLREKARDPLGGIGADTPFRSAVGSTDFAALADEVAALEAIRETAKNLRDDERHKTVGVLADLDALDAALARLEQS
jgi:hypothetical protein